MWNDDDRVILLLEGNHHGDKVIIPPPPAVTKTRKITRKPYATLSNTNKNTDIRRMITYLV